MPAALRQAELSPREQEESSVRRDNDKDNVGSRGDGSETQQATMQPGKGYML